MKKIILPLLIGLFLLQVTSCNKEDTLEDVTINFINPFNGQEIDLANAEEFQFNIVVTADKDLHDIFFTAFPTNDPSDKVVDIKRHRHDTEIEIVQIRDLSSYPSGTEFTIEIEVCVDHDCSATPVQESITFSVV
jgi:hypothetical protein